MKKFCLVILFYSLAISFCAAAPIRLGIADVNVSDDVSRQMLKNYLINYTYEIAKQTQRHFEYHSGPPDVLKQKLAAGELDLIAPVNPAAVKDDGMIFTSGYVCYGMIGIYAKKDSPLTVEGVADAANEIPVGMIAGSEMNEQFFYWAEDNGWKASVREFANAADMNAALESGSVVAVIDDGSNVPRDAKCLVSFATIEEQFMAKKENAALIDEINDAVINIETRNPFFETWLEQEFLDPAVQHMAGFSTAEKNFAAASDILHVGFLPPVLPLYDAGNSIISPGGIYVDFLNLAADISGLKFDFRQLRSTDMIKNRLENGEIDMAFAVYGGEFADGVHFSNDFLKEDFSVVERRRVNDGSEKTAAIPMLFVGMKEFFAERYPDVSLRQYNTVEDCLNAVENGKCSVAFIPSVYLARENTMVMRPNLVLSDEETVRVPICLAISPSKPQILQHVINTAVLMITNDQVKNIIQENARPRLSVGYILSQYTMPAAMMLCVFVIGGAATFFIFIRSRMQEKQNMMLTLKNAELQAALDAVETMRRDRDTYKNESETDHLTGLSNKMAMETICQYRLEKFPDGIMAALYIVDLDHFKEANDTYGHQYGDEILRSFARSLRSIFRNTDAVARFGGDEFIVFIAAIPDPGIVERQARHILQIAKSIMLNGQPAKITASIGIALAPQQGKDYADLFRNADRALYQVKENGRDGFCIYQSQVVH